MLRRKEYRDERTDERTNKRGKKKKNGRLAGRDWSVSGLSDRRKGAGRGLVNR